jgi:hypothetical protein
MVRISAVARFVLGGSRRTIIGRRSIYIFVVLFVVVALGHRRDV